MIQGLQKNTVFLSDQNSFNVSVYSTYNILSFRIEQSDGNSSVAPAVTVLEMRTFLNIKAVYRVEIPTAMVGMRVAYTATVVAEGSGNTDSHTVTVVKPRGWRRRIL